MYDVTGNRKGVNPVTNTKYTAAYEKQHADFYDGSNWVYAIQNCFKSFDRHVADRVAPGLVGTAPFQAAVNSAFMQISQQIPTEVSIANFLLEARELGSLIPKITSNLVRSASGSYLTYQFGWKPLLDDLRKLANIANSVEMRLNYLRSTFGREVRASYYQDVALPGTVPDTTYDTGGSYAYRYVRSDHRAIFRASGYIYHELEGLDSAEGTVRAFIGALGLNNPVQVFWNNLPYSFVLDWFADFGGLLDRLALNPMAGMWRVSRASCSVSEKAVVSVYQNFFPQYAANQAANQNLLGKVFIERYNRVVGFPVDPGFWLSPSNLGPQQQLLGAALLGVRL
jgi:hypothetical protein